MLGGVAVSAVGVGITQPAESGLGVTTIPLVSAVGIGIAQSADSGLGVTVISLTTAAGNMSRRAGTISPSNVTLPGSASRTISASDKTRPTQIIASATSTLLYAGVARRYSPMVVLFVDRVALA